MAMKAATLKHTHHALPAWEQWVLRHWRKFELAGSVVVLIAAMSVFWQVNYPVDTALPAVKMGGLDIGGKSRDDIVAELREFSETGTITVSSPSREWTAKMQEIGLSVDPEASADAALAYETWERFVPFSSVLKLQQTPDLPLVALIDDDRLDAFAQKLVAEDKQAAEDATIRVTDGKVVINDAKNGYIYNIDDIKQQVQAAAVGLDAKLTLTPERVAYVRSATELQTAKNQAETVLAHAITLKVGEQVFTPDSTTVGNWLDFAEDPQTKQLGLIFNANAIREYLGGIDEKTRIAPGSSTVTLLDGAEISRTPAAAGKTVAADASVQAIQAALAGPAMEPAVNLALADVPPRVSYVRTYSQTNAGIGAIIRDWDASYYGDYAVIVRELGGQNRGYEFNPDKSYVTASTFKMFTYYAVQDRIQKGAITYGTMTDMGWTVEACLTEMIVKSTNPCAISLMNLVGWPESQAIVAAGGFGATNINNQFGGDKHSSVRDEADFLTRLHYGTLMGQEATDRLLGYMKRQVWRAGIPSGVPRGVTVADKVGLYDGWVHDVAIVYSPKATYILAIMSKGGSDPAFANLSSRMYNFFQN